MMDLLGLAPVIRVIDFEGTGLEGDVRVIEVGHIDLDPATLTIERPETYLCGTDAIPPDSRAVHHIRLEDVKGFPPYDRRLVFEHAVRAGVFAFAAHTSSYEEKFLMGHLPCICTHKASLRVWPEAPSHSVFGLLYWLEDRGEVQYDRAQAYPNHRALPDAYATAILLRRIFELGHTGRELFQWTREPALLPRCPIGDWRGAKWEDVETSFLEWILRKIYDREDVRFCASRELDRREMINE